MMNTDDMTPEEMEGFWAMAVEDFKGSGLAKSAYCQQNDLSYSTFRYWLRKFDDQQAASEDHGSQFAELHLSSFPSRQEQPTGIGSSVSLSLPSELAILYYDAVISIGRDTPMSLLADVIGVIRDAQ